MLKVVSTYCSFQATNALPSSSIDFAPTMGAMTNNDSCCNDFCTTLTKIEPRNIKTNQPIMADFNRVIPDPAKFDKLSAINVSKLGGENVPLIDECVNGALLLIDIYIFDAMELVLSPVVRALSAKSNKIADKKFIKNIANGINTIKSNAFPDWANTFLSLF